MCRLIPPPDRLPDDVTDLVVQCAHAPLVELQQLPDHGAAALGCSDVGAGCPPHVGQGGQLRAVLQEELHHL